MDRSFKFFEEVADHLIRMFENDIDDVKPREKVKTLTTNRNQDMTNINKYELKSINTKPSNKKPYSTRKIINDKQNCKIRVIHVISWTKMRKKTRGVNQGG